MILYNVSSHVEPEIENQWLEWVHEKHLPEMMATDVFFSAMLLRIKNGFEALETAFAVQYSANNPEDIDRFLKENKLKL